MASEVSAALSGYTNAYLLRDMRDGEEVGSVQLFQPKAGDGVSISLSPQEARVLVRLLSLAGYDRPAD